MKRTTSQPLQPAAVAPDCVLLDEDGRPLNPRLAGALVALIPRFRRTFNVLRDDATIVDVIEEAGRRIAHRETRFGPVDRLHSYAWVTLTSVATSLLRRGSARLEGHSPIAGGSGPLAARLVATTGTAEQIQRAILIRELLGHLPPHQRFVCLLRLEGFTSQEIADRRGCTAVAIDVLLSRARLRLRRLVSTDCSAPPSAAQASQARQTVESAARRGRSSGRRGPRHTPTSDERFHPQVASDQVAGLKSVR